MEKKGKILALDVGRSKIGLAISDVSHEFVFGRGILKISREKGLNPVLGKIYDLIVHEGVIGLIVGLPLDSNGEETTQTAYIRSFVDKLRLKIALPVDFIDESFSSFEASNLLSKLSINSMQQRKLEDELAAVLILKRFLKIP